MTITPYFLYITSIYYSEKSTYKNLSMTDPHFKIKFPTPNPQLS